MASKQFLGFVSDQTNMAKQGDNFWFGLLSLQVARAAGVETVDKTSDV